MFSFLAPYKLLFQLVVITTVIIGLIYGSYALLVHERNMGYQTAVEEYTTKQLLSEAAARDKENQLLKQVQEAEHATHRCEQEITRLSGAVAAGNK
jgi:hypothetical protein